jgi:hypothetical protein
MSDRDVKRPSTPAVRPPPPSHPDDGPDPVLVPPLEPPPSSLGALATRRKKAPSREPRLFWIVLIVLFVVGTLLTFYLQRPR